MSAAGKFLAGMVVAGAIGMAADANAITFQGSIAVTDFNEVGSGGLNIITRPVVGGVDGNSNFLFDLNPGQSTGFQPIFEIWTDEAAVNGDDFNGQPLSLTLNFTLPAPPFSSGATGTSVAGTIFIASSGVLTWDNGGVFDIAFGNGGLMTLTMEDTTEIFNGGFGLGLKPGRAHGALVKGKITLVEAPDPVPEPATLALLGAGVLGLGAAARRRTTAA